MVSKRSRPQGSEVNHELHKGQFKNQLHRPGHWDSGRNERLFTASSAADDEQQHLISADHCTGTEDILPDGTSATAERKTDETVCIRPRRRGEHIYRCRSQTDSNDGRDAVHEHAAMKETVQLARLGAEYAGRIKLPMVGLWGVSVEVMRQDKMVATYRDTISVQ